MHEAQLRFPWWHTQEPCQLALYSLLKLDRSQPWSREAMTWCSFSTSLESTALASGDTTRGREAVKP